MKYPSYESLQGLSDEGVAALATQGDAAERIWAAWTQGIRFGQAYSKTFTAYVDTEPNSGIRRHLIVMLAGFWAEEMAADTTSANAEQPSHSCKKLLDALARIDPHERVRATAWKHLIHLQDLTPNECADGFSDPSQVVRKTILETIAPERFTRPEEQLIPFLRDSDASVRQAALDVWTRCQSVDHWFSMSFIKYLESETYRPLKRRLAVLCRIAHREDILEDQLQFEGPAFVRSHFLPMVRR